MTLKPLSPGNIYVALVHYPVRNKNGDAVASAITNLDLHDIARASRTYGASRFYVITPLVDQQQLAQKIVDHWTTGGGATYNPKRAEAFKLVKIVEDLNDVLAAIKAERGMPPIVVTTSAQTHPDNVDFSFMRDQLKNRDVVLVLGTAWGLDKIILEKADYILEPVAQKSDYNHLSVRSALSIMLDRLIGDGI